VYIDQDGDHRLGAAELSAKTGADGLYCISNIPPGNITVAEETRDGWTRVFPSSGTELIVNGGFETGDANGWQALGSLAVCDATFGSGPVAGQYQACLATGPGSVPVADLEVFLGLADGAISSQGEGLVVEGSAIKQQIVVQAGAVLSGTWNFLTDESESAYAMNDFAVLAIAPAAPELLAVAGDAIWPSPTAFFSETGAMSFSHVFARGGVYSVGLAVVDVGDALVDSALTLDAVHVQASPGAHVVALAPDATETNVNFGNVAVVPAEVHGRKWHDLNGDGQRDAEEPGLPDWTIYLDLNANAQLDGGEPFGVSGLDGSYAIEGLLPGTYRIEEVVHPPWKQTYPAAARFLTLTPAASVENVDFANALAGSISGKKWHDLDGDGEWDAAEPALADWIFYVDENLNGWRDSGEPFTLTDGDGNYALTNLNMGQNRVGEVLPSDWIQTAGGTGTGLVEFEEGTVAFATDPNAISVELTDVDGDLVADLVLLCSGPDTLKIAVNNGLGGFSSTVSFSVTGTARASATGDVDGDGDSDVVVATGDPAGVAVLANSDGYFTAVAEYDTGLLDSLYLVDLDWDGDLDLIGAGYGSDSVSVLRNDGVGRFQLPSTDYHVGNGPGCVGAGDLDGDGDQDVVSANDLDHTVSVLLNDGLGTLGNALSYAAGLNPFRLQLSDADGDGDLDIVVANRTADTVGVLLNGGDATFSAPLTYPVGVMPNGLVVADLDMDGVDDIVTADRDSDTLSLYGNTVTGLYLLAQISVDDMPVALAAGDVDGDGDRDLAVVHSGALDVSVLYNRFRSNFAEHNLESGAVVAGVDFGNSRLASIRGTVWHDLNGDGQRQEEDYGLRGWTVFMDSNNNGRFDLAEQTAWTDHTGAYVFTSLKPSDCTVRVTAREGWAPTYPTNPGYPLTLMSGETIQDVDFAYHGEPPLIFGSVWHDNDGNGSWDDGEPALAGWTVYDDVNTNALLDSAEQFATTDIAGNYALSNLVPGGHFVVQVLKPVWMQTYAGSANTMFLSELVAYDQISSPHGLEFDFTQALAPTGDGELVVYAKGDFGSSYEDLNVTAEGVSLANLFVLGGADCSMVTATVDIPGNTLADLAQDGVISFTVRFSHYVDDECSDPVLGLRLSYPAEGAPLQVGWGQELRVDFGNLLTNLPPLILSNSPHAYALAIPEATNSAFAAYATDPEGSNISYSWRWADTPVGVDSNTFTRETDWGDAGAYELRVTVSDGVWTNIWTNWSVTILGDNDSDGMSNWWENLYGLDPFVNDALLDRDEDGFINLWEQLAGTIPTNPHSSLEITNVVAVSGNDVLVRWLSVSNRFYRLESASNLIHGFSCIESNIPATPAVNTYTDDVGSVMFRFYRIMLEQ